MDQSPKKQYEDLVLDSSKGSRAQYDIDFSNTEDIFDLLAIDEEQDEDGGEIDIEDHFKSSLQQDIDAGTTKWDESDYRLPFDDSLVEGNSESSLEDSQAPDNASEPDPQTLSLAGDLERHVDSGPEENTDSGVEESDCEPFRSLHDESAIPTEVSLKESMNERIESTPDQLLSSGDEQQNQLKGSVTDTLAADVAAGSFLASSSALSQGDDMTLDHDLVAEREREERVETEPEDGMQESVEGKALLANLKGLILSIDWEISNDVLGGLTRELRRLKAVWADKKIDLVYVQAMEKLARYVYVERGDAHPGALQLLSHLYDNLEKLVTSSTLGEAERKELLKNDVNRFALLKEQIREGVVGSSSFSDTRETSGTESEAGSVAGKQDAELEPVVPGEEAFDVDPVVVKEKIVAEEAVDFESVTTEEETAETDSFVDKGEIKADPVASQTADSKETSLENFTALSLQQKDSDFSQQPVADLGKEDIFASLQLEEEKSEDDIAEAEDESESLKEDSPTVLLQEKEEPAEEEDFLLISDEVALQGDSAGAQADDNVGEDELSLQQRDSDFSHQPVADLEKEDIFASLQLEEEESEDDIAEVEDESESLKEDSPTVLLQEKEEPAEEKDFSFISDEVALQGVNVDMEADDDVGEEELPRENGELAPALSNVFAESAAIDVDSDIEATVSSFFEEGEDKEELQVTKEKSMQQDRGGVFVAGPTVALAALAGAVGKEKSVSKQKSPVVTERMQLDDVVEETSTIQRSSLDDEDSRQADGIEILTADIEDELVIEEADNDWPPPGESVVVQSDIFLDSAGSSSVTELEGEEYDLVLGEDDEIELLSEETVRPVEYVSLAEQTTVEEAGEIVSELQERTDEDIDILSASMEEEQAGEEAILEVEHISVQEKGAAETAEETVFMQASSVEVEKEIVDDTGSSTVSCAEELIVAEEIDEDWSLDNELAVVEPGLDMDTGKMPFSAEPVDNDSFSALEEAGDSEQQEEIASETEIDDFSISSGMEAISPEDVALLVNYCEKLQKQRDEEQMTEMLMLHNRLVEVAEGRPLELHFLLLFAAVTDYMKHHDEKMPVRLLISIASTLQQALVEKDLLEVQKLLLRESARVLDWFGGLVE